jgi:hypothetical protein
MNGSSRALSQGGVVVVVSASSGNGMASTTLPQSSPSAGNGTRTTTVARKKKHVVIDDDTVPHRPKMVRVPTKAEFNPKGLEDEEEDEEDEEEDSMKNPAVTRTKYSDAGLPLDPDANAAAPAHTYYAPPRAQPAAAQRREGRVTPPLPLPQPKNILKKVSAYQLPPPPQPPTLNGGINSNNSSNSSGQAFSRGNSFRGNSSTQAPPLGAGPARRSMRQLSFADELGRELHEVTHAHNLQYASNYRQSAPMACCIVS